MLAPKDAGFEQVQTMANPRTGGMDIRWNRALVDSGVLPEDIRPLLARRLGAEEAVQIALLNNRELQAVYEDLDVSRAALIQAGLLHNPIFEGSLKIHGDDDVFEFAVAQDFLSVFTIPLRRARARAEFEQVKLRVTSAVIGMAGQTRMAFYRYQAVRTDLEFLKTILKANEAAYEAAQRLYNAGNITFLDLSNQRSLYEQARLDVSRAEVAYVAAREQLNTLMGLYGGEDILWKAKEDLPPVPERMPCSESLETRAVGASLDLAAARWRIASSSRVLGLERVKSIIPELGAGVEGEREPDGTWFIGPMLEYAIPLFDWGQGSRRRAEAELRRAWREYTATAVKIRSAIRSAHYEAMMAHQQAIHYRDVLLPLNERIMNETQLQYNAMQMGVFSLLMAKQREILTRREYVMALRDYWIAQTRLNQILSGVLVQRGAPVGINIEGAPMQAEGGH
jgi:cobalt-zinc-cadmium efflux system outer membrane protein